MAMRYLVLGFSAMVLCAQNADLAKELVQPRQRIDSIDHQIVQLLNERAQVVRDVGLIKKKYNAPVSVPGREEQVVHRAGEGARAPLTAPAVEAIYRTILHEMSGMEQTEVERSR